MKTNRSMVAQMAERATQDGEFPGSIPAWIQLDFASKYMAYFFRLTLLTRSIGKRNPTDQASNSSLDISLKQCPPWSNYAGLRQARVAHHRVYSPDTQEAMSSLFSVSQPGFRETTCFFVCFLLSALFRNCLLCWDHDRETACCTSNKKIIVLGSWQMEPGHCPELQCSHRQCEGQHGQELEERKAHSSDSIWKVQKNFKICSGRGEQIRRSLQSCQVLAGAGKRRYVENIDKC